MGFPPPPIDARAATLLARRARSALSIEESPPSGSLVLACFAVVAVLLAASIVGLTAAHGPGRLVDLLLLGVALLLAYAGGLRTGPLVAVALVATYIALEGHYGRLDHTHAGSVAAFSILFAVATLAGAALADGFESWNAGASEPGPATWYDGDAPFEEDPGEPLELDSLETILTGAVAAHGALSLLLARPDGIDGLGHDRGQRATRAVLECVADVLRGHLRGTDVLHRHGLFEFWVVLPRTSLEAARMTAERVRLAVGELPVSLGEGDQERCSLSIGIASCPIDGRSPASLRDAAERALAGAVELGGNRTVLHSVPPGAPRGWGLAREVPVGAAQLARRSLE